MDIFVCEMYIGNEEYWLEKSKKLKEFKICIEI